MLLKYGDILTSYDNILEAQAECCCQVSSCCHWELPKGELCKCLGSLGHQIVQGKAKLPVVIPRGCTVLKSDGI